MKLKSKIPAIFSALLIIALALTGCPTPDSPVEEEGGSTTGRPTITVQPVSVDYVTGNTIAPLTVTATAGGGTPSYQWYSVDSYTNSGGTPVSGAAGASYSPDISGTGTYYYYVIVTGGTDENPLTVSSNPARIRVSETAPVLDKSITVNTAAKHQYVRGFGGMANVWTSPDMTVRDIETMFNPTTGLGLNMLRICLYPYMDDIIDNIEIPDRDNSDYYELVKRVNRHGGYVLASPWTPPAEWKDPPQREGRSHLRPANYGVYAQHLKDFSQRMYDNGAPIYAVSIQNEPNFEAAYDGCEWTSDQQRNFFQQVGHFTDGVKGYGGGREIPAVLTMTGEVANNVAWNNAAVNDPTASAAIDIVGYHIYGSLETRYANALENPTKPKETWMTEHNLNTPADYSLDSRWDRVWVLLNEVHHVIANNDSSAFIWWYAKRFYSFIGDGEYGTVDGEPLWRGYALSHYAKFASNTNRVELAAEGISSFNVGSSGVRATAYESLDSNSIALVIYNSGSAAEGEIQINFPDGFVAASAYAIITDGIKKAAADLVSISSDGRTGIINLPASAIVSARFTR
jgi:O-glycosyl hydrolase